MDAATPKDLPSPSLGVDRVELNVKGTWVKSSRERLETAVCGKLRLAGESVNKIEGGYRHGPDFYSYMLCREGEFRIDVSKKRRQYDGRFYLFGPLLDRAGLVGATAILRRFAHRIGFNWESEQVSRLDLRADIAVPFDEFSQRIDRGCFVTHLNPPERNDAKHYPTTRYFGTKPFVRLRIYDKVREALDRQAKKNKGNATTAGNRRPPSIGPPLTRVEFEANRKWLVRQKIDSLADVDLPEIWRELCRMIRLTNRPPHTKHQDQCPNWLIWDAVRQAQWSGEEQGPGPALSPKEQSRSPQPWEPTWQAECRHPENCSNPALLGRQLPLHQLSDGQLHRKGIP